ncbi:MAG TPA: hypothetical protein VKP64_11120, partial [Mycobacteriales bacterium]|nr:hypothetical protein [Mycobacteriales bacterium]
MAEALRRGGRGLRLLLGRPVLAEHRRHRAVAGHHVRGVARVEQGGVEDGGAALGVERAEPGRVRRLGGPARR